MRNIFTLALSLCISLTVIGQEEKPALKFETETIDYGKIPLGSDGKRVFIFTNVGSAPLIITRVQASCGCTVPKKPDAPVMPGENGQIEVSYDTKRPGGFSKAITIFSNAKTPRKILKIKGFVEKVVAPEKKQNMLSDDS